MPRAGTTWLHQLLSSHSALFLPERRKELHYFSEHYERGVEWYAKFFPLEDAATAYEAVGEISPQYLYCEACPGRMAKSGHVEKLMILLRDPMERLVSHYVFWKGRYAYRGEFTDFIDDLPGAVEWGFYAHYLKRYLRYFHRSDILPLVFEHAVENVEETRSRCARFLGVDPGGLPPGVERRSSTDATVRNDGAYTRWV